MTNAARILERMGVRFELRDYEVDPDHLDAETVAAKVGMVPEQVWKTLLCRGDRNGCCFAVIPANTTLDLKELARLSGDKKVDTVPLKELTPLTGYIRGGCTVLGARKAFPVFADETIEICDLIAVSAGVRGTQIILDPADYVKAVGAKLGPIATAKQ